MDDVPDDRYSRAPQVEDLVELCRSLNASGAQYILIGGFAVILHGLVRGTKDVDLLVEASPANIRRLKEAMAVLPDNAIALMADDEVERYGVVRVADEFVVDLMARACSIDYRQALTLGVESIEVEGVPVPVAGPELLIRTKQTPRPQDAADVLFLRRLLGEER